MRGWGKLCGKQVMALLLVLAVWQAWFPHRGQGGYENAREFDTAECMRAAWHGLPCLQRGREPGGVQPFSAAVSPFSALRVIRFGICVAWRFRLA